MQRDAIGLQVVAVGQRTPEVTREGQPSTNCHRRLPPAERLDLLQPAKT